MFPICHNSFTACLITNFSTMTTLQHIVLWHAEFYCSDGKLRYWLGGRKGNTPAANSVMVTLLIEVNLGGVVKIVVCVCVLQKVLTKDLDAEWRDKFGSFDPKPFAAASIGQVHKATLHDGQMVAVKIQVIVGVVSCCSMYVNLMLHNPFLSIGWVCTWILWHYVKLFVSMLQYPGVAESINSDINNLVSLLKVWEILPKGWFLHWSIQRSQAKKTASFNNSFSSIYSEAVG